MNSGNKIKVKQLKICENCFIFYFHVNRFYDLDMYANLVEKKNPLIANPHPNNANPNESVLRG